MSGPRHRRIDRLARPLAATVAAFVLSGCSIFGGDDDEEELEPVELVDIEETLDVRQLWSETCARILRCCRHSHY